MDLLTRDELVTLMEDCDALCVSIYMPTYRTSREVLQNSARLKNLLASAEKQLVTQGLRAPLAREWLAPARTLLEDQQFWQYQSDGLAIFISSELFQTYCLPLEFDDLVIVSPQFYVKPLLPLLTGDGKFYLLTLSQDQIRLLQGSRFSITEMSLEGTDVPKSMAEALQYDEPLSQLQFHTQTQDIRGERPGMFHGHGVGKDDEKTNLRRYFQKVDKGLQALLPDEPVPLVLAGVEYLFPIYREANTYPHLIEEGVQGNVEHLNAKALHEQAWAVVQPYFEQVRQEAIVRYQNSQHTDLASSDIRAILPAAHYGRVDTLFVDTEAQLWGTFDPDQDQVNLRGEAEAGDADLINAVATQTLLNGGLVLSVEPGDALNGSPVAAIFRYSLAEQAEPDNQE
jgi:hypothetical protein